MLDKYLLSKYMNETKTKINAQRKLFKIFSEVFIVLLVIWGNSSKGFEKKATDHSQALF